MEIIKKQIGISETSASYILAAAIAIMFFYAVINKLSDFETSKQEMMNQVFPAPIAFQLAWAIPSVELIITCLLIFKSTQFIGFVASAITMAVFSLYIAVTMSGVFGRIPCSCGGILKNMDYGTHLIFNLLFLMMAFAGIAIKQHWMGIYLKS